MSNVIKYRQNIETLQRPENKHLLKKFRNAYKSFMHVGDDRGYNHIAGYHGVPQFFCWHHQRDYRTLLRGRLFLPWHRAYLDWFEKSLQQTSDYPDVTIPFWDWSSTLSKEKGIPSAFNDEKTEEGEDNPLYSVEYNSPTSNPPLTGFTERITDDLIPNLNRLFPVPKKGEKSWYDKLMDLEDFGDFSDELENYHDWIHGSVGGSMTIVALAAFDPIFWSHHAMIDRLWYIWQNKHDPIKGLENILDFPLAPFWKRVKDVIKIYDLGYEYANSVIQIPIKED